MTGKQISQACNSVYRQIVAEHCDVGLFSPAATDADERCSAVNSVDTIYTGIDDWVVDVVRAGVDRRVVLQSYTVK